ncbi:MAG: type II secretion system protein [Lachnospiraceae bacterium]
MKRKHQKGFTLVELIVSFAVLSILLTAAVATVSPASKVFLHTINVGRAQMVGGLLMDKITNELGAAPEIIKVTEGAEGMVQYIDRGGNVVIMKRDPEDTKLHKLQLHYDDADATNWFFSDKVYMNNAIEKLEFSEVPDKENLIQVKLQLKNTQTGATFGRTRMIQCYAVEQ